MKSNLDTVIHIQGPLCIRDGTFNSDTNQMQHLLQELNETAHEELDQMVEILNSPVACTKEQMKAEIIKILILQSLQ